MKRILSGLALSILAGAAQADVWVFDPAASLDLRVDDNFTIDDTSPTRVAATRLVGSLGISREDQINAFNGFLRVDGLLTLGDDGSGGEGGELDSNQLGFIEYTRTRPRSSFGIRLSGLRDTPNRDISDDITNFSETASDTGIAVTQTENVVRQRITLTPKFSYELSRRSTFTAEVNIIDVNHSTPSPDDAIRTQFALANPDVEIPDNLVIEDLSAEGVAVPFQVADEEDDFEEQSISLGYRYKLSTISNFSASISFSRFSTETEPEAGVITPFDDLDEDSDNRFILRAPLRNATANTTQFRLGYDTRYTERLSFGVQLGAFNTEFDRSELFLESDSTGLSPEDVAETIDGLVGNDVGFLGAFTATYLTNISRYTGAISLDVLSSNVGSPVESLRITGDYQRAINPLLDFGLNVTLIEPDAISTDEDTEFIRRFFSVEPKAVWRFTRSFTAGVAYRFRLQTGQLDEGTGTSNALLFSIKYRPPLKIRDLREGA